MIHYDTAAAPLYMYREHKKGLDFFVFCCVEKGKVKTTQMRKKNVVFFPPQLGTNVELF